LPPFQGSKIVKPNVENVVLIGRRTAGLGALSGPIGVMRRMEIFVAFERAV
jgi:hypothetical protein